MVTRIVFSLLILCISLSNQAQELVCGTKATAKDIEALKKLKVEIRSLRTRSAEFTPVNIAIKAHISRRSDGTGGLTPAELDQAMTDVNNIYAGTNLSFFLFGDINYIDDDNYFDFDASQEFELTSVHDVQDVINVYFFNSASSNGSALCGYAYFPETGIDHLVMVNDCTTNGSTFPHEIGHYFSLYHTHGKTNTGTTDELVDGSNCTTAGDDICDTAADPNLSGNVNISCSYTGIEVDANGETFIPNPRNLMSYSRKECRDEFSQGQMNRIVAAYEEYKTYLISKNYAAFFDAPQNEVCEGESVTFQNNSVGASSYSWTFEGGTPATSIEENPVIMYATSGKYDVTLTITEPGGETDVRELVDYVTVKEITTSNLISENGGFEEEDFKETVINLDNGFTFERTTEAFQSGLGSAFIDMFNYTSQGQEDFLVIGTLNTVEQKEFTIAFDYAYAPYDDVYYDGLAVVYRDVCGEWVTVWEKYGSDLQTTNPEILLFIPEQDEWGSETITFAVPELIETVEVAFKSINGWGNALYLDNYEVIASPYFFSIDGIEAINASCDNSTDGSFSVLTTSTETLSFQVNESEASSSNSFINLDTGSYTLSVINSIGTIKTQEVTIGYENVSPDKPEILAEDGELRVEVDEDLTIQWYFDEIFIEEANGPSLNSLGSGSYTVEVSNGSCASVSEPFIILSAAELSSTLKLYPNPATNQLSFLLPSSFIQEMKALVIRDLSGREIRTTDFVEVLNVEELESGMYLLELIGDGFNINKRFLKK